MIKKSNFFDFKDQHSKRLKVAKSSRDTMKIANQKTQQRSAKFSSHGGSSGEKGGVVYAGKSIVVKSNYTVAGRRYKDGIASRKAVGSHAAASLQYMDNHGSKDIEDQNLSNIYDENGERLTKEELKDLLNSLKNDEENQAMRRTMIDIGQEDLTREELSKVVRESISEFKEQTGNSFDFKYAIHTNTDQIHAHVLSTGDAKDIMINKEQIQDLKLIIAEKTEQVVQERELNFDKQIDKFIDQEKDKNLTLNQQIDKELDGKLDNKFREEDIKQALKELEKEQQHNQGLSL